MQLAREAPAAPGPRGVCPPVELAADLLFSITVESLRVEPCRRSYTTLMKIDIIINQFGYWYCCVIVFYLRFKDQVLEQLT